MFQNLCVLLCWQNGLLTINDITYKTTHDVSSNTIWRMATGQIKQAVGCNRRPGSRSAIGLWLAIFKHIIAPKSENKRCKKYSRQGTAYAKT